MRKKNFDEKKIIFDEEKILMRKKSFDEKKKFC